MFTLHDLFGVIDRKDLRYELWNKHSLSTKNQEDVVLLAPRKTTAAMSVGWMTAMMIGDRQVDGSKIPWEFSVNCPRQITCWSVVSNIFLVSLLFGEDWTKFDSYFSNGLVQPPTSIKVFLQIFEIEKLVKYSHPEQCLEMSQAWWEDPGGMCFDTFGCFIYIDSFFEEFLEAFVGGMLMVLYFGGIWSPVFPQFLWRGLLPTW